MPIYDFHCTECDASRDVNVPIAERDSLDLLCHACGGEMKRNMAPLVMFGGNAKSSQDAQPGKAAKACGHTHHCRCNAIKLKRPNPLKQQVGAVNSSTSGNAAA